MNEFLPEKAYRTTARLDSEFLPPVFQKSGKFRKAIANHSVKIFRTEQQNPYSMLTIALIPNFADETIISDSRSFFIGQS